MAYVRLARCCICNKIKQGDCFKKSGSDFKCRRIKLIHDISSVDSCNCRIGNKKYRNSGCSKKYIRNNHIHQVNDVPSNINISNIYRTHYNQDNTDIKHSHHNSNPNPEPKTRATQSLRPISNTTQSLRLIAPATHLDFVSLSLKGETKEDNFCGYRKLVQIDDVAFGTWKLPDEVLMIERERSGNKLYFYEDSSHLINMIEGIYNVSLNGNLRVFSQTNLDKVLVGVNLRFLYFGDDDTQIYLTGFKHIVESYTTTDLSVVDLFDPKYLVNHNFAINRVFNNKSPKSFSLQFLVKILGNKTDQVEKIYIDSSNMDLIITKIK